MLLQSVLFGKGREISTQLSVEQVASKRRIHSGVQTFIDEQKAEMWKTLHNLQKIFHWDTKWISWKKPVSFTLH